MGNYRNWSWSPRDRRPVSDADNEPVGQEAAFSPMADNEAERGTGHLGCVF